MEGGRLVNIQLFPYLLEGLRCEGCSCRMDGNVRGEERAKFPKLAVSRSEVATPLQDTVHFIDSDSANVVERLGEGIAEIANLKAHLWRRQNCLKTMPLEILSST